MMPFYPPNPRRRPFPPMYRQNFRAPYQGRQGQRFFNPYQQFQQPQQPQQPNVSRFGRLPEHINTIMGHAGTIKNGVNVIMQVGSFLRSFR